jgi:type I restriction enzyme S subunit
MSVPALRFPEFEGEWIERKSGDFSTVIRGTSPRPKRDPRYYGGGVPRLMVEDADLLWG